MKNEEKRLKLEDTLHLLYNRIFKPKIKDLRNRIFPEDSKKS